MQNLYLQLAGALFDSAFVWAMYMALEPYVRRHWPQALISWTKLLNGGVRDPVVAGHFLLGMAAGIALMLPGLVLQRLAIAPFVPVNSYLEPVSLAAVRWIGGLAAVPTITLVVFFLLFLSRLVLRRTWLAFIVVMLVFAATAVPQGLSPAAIAISLTIVSTLVAVGLRFGVLPLVATIFFNTSNFPFSDLSSWLGKVVLMQVGLTIAAAVWNFRNALGGRKVLTGDFLDR